MALRQARQERLLERQRGAGRRVKDDALRLHLTAQNDVPLEPRKSGRSRNTPRPDTLLPQISSRRTPNTQLIAPLASNFTSAAPVSDLKRSRGRPPSASKSNKRPRDDPEGDGAGQGSTDLPGKGPKRLKADEQPAGRTVKDATTNNLNPTLNKDSNPGVSPDTRPKKPKKRTSIGQQASKRSKPSILQRDNKPIDPIAGARGRPKAIRLDQPERNLDDEIQDQLRRENSSLERSVCIEGAEQVLPSVEPTEGTGFTPRHQKRKKRVSIGQQAKRKPKHKLITVKEEPLEHSSPVIENVPDRPETVDEDLEDIRTRNSNAGSDRSTDDNLEPHREPSETVQEPKTKRKKRKSIGQQKRKKPPKEGSASAHTPKRTIEQTKVPARRNKAARSEIAQPKNTKNKSKPAGMQARPKSRGKPPKIALARKIEDTKATRKLGSQVLPSSKPVKTTAARKPACNLIPITVYRPPTSISPAPSDDDEAITTGSTLQARKTFNAVDVLAQITLERLSKSAAKLSSQSSSSRIQRKALELYTKEVESRLRQLSQALDKNKALSAESKRLVKEERALKAEIKKVEAGKKEVKERQDDLEQRRKRLELESLLGRIQKVARKGWQIEQPGGSNEEEDL